MLRRSSFIRRRPQCSDIFFTENRLANQSHILCKASMGRGNEICSRHLGHITKVAAMPIYGKILKPSSPKQVDQFP